MENRYGFLLGVMKMQNQAVVMTIQPCEYAKNH